MVEILEERERGGWADRTMTSVSLTGLTVKASAEEGGLFAHLMVWGCMRSEYAI
jgi:hypothetical protein